MGQEVAKCPSLGPGADCEEEQRRLSLKAVSKFERWRCGSQGEEKKEEEQNPDKTRLWERGK